jgi:hypothetical protein
MPFGLSAMLGCQFLDTGSSAALLTFPYRLARLPVCIMSELIERLHLAVHGQEEREY